MKRILIACLLGVLVTASNSPSLLFPIVEALHPYDPWSPYGPRSSKLQFSFHSDDLAALNQFELGKLDLAASPVPRFKWQQYEYTPDFVLTRPQPELGMFQIDINHVSSDWTAWGCNFDHGNSPCGIEIRKALAHLVDRPEFVLASIIGGAGTALADPSPSSKLPSGSPAYTTQQSWDPVHNTVNAFNIASDRSGFATPGSPDFCAARDHMVAAAIGFVDDNNDCVIDNPPTTPIRYLIRNDHSARRQLGLGHIAAINALFGTDVVAETLGNIVQLLNIVFSLPADDWSMYTGGWSLAGTFVEHLQALYGSTSASDLCGGRRTNMPLNYGAICVPAFDAHVAAAMEAGNFDNFSNETLAALDEFGKRALNIPVYAGAERFAALRDMTGRVDATNVGPSNFWTILNGMADPYYTPSNSLYTFGGSSGSDTLRWGQRTGTTTLNIFHLTSWADANVLSEIYDTLTIPSPIEPQKTISWMANKYTITADSIGDTHIVFDLRSSLTFHDGHPVTAEDVKFSILNFRNLQGSFFQSYVEMVRDVVVHGALKVEIIFRGGSFLHLFNITVPPIIPKHLWDTNDDGVVDADKADPSFDPLAAGMLIGSGPFVCRSVFPVDQGRIGTGCARNLDGTRAGQSIPPGGTMVLEKFDLATPSAPYRQYMRSYNPAWPNSPSGQFQEWSWADKDNNIKVDVTDIASVAACFGKTGPDTTCPAETYTYWNILGDPNSITEEAVRVASRLDETWIDPFEWIGDYRLGQPPSLVDLVGFTP